MRSHTRLAAIAGLAFIALTALVDSDSLPWALPVLPILAAFLNRTRWTDLACLRVIQAAAAGQATAIVAAMADAPAVVVPGAALVGLAAIVTGYGVVKFPVRPRA